MKINRTLTRKSKLDFGKYRELTVQRIIDLRKPLVLISSYYKLSSISFTDDILEELKILDKFKIDKPGKDHVMYYRFLNQNGYRREVRDRLNGANRLKREKEIYSKSKLQRINQGKY